LLFSAIASPSQPSFGEFPCNILCKLLGGQLLRPSVVAEQRGIRLQFQSTASVYHVRDTAGSKNARFYLITVTPDCSDRGSRTSRLNIVAHPFIGKVADSP
jgi:hypothetical protein